MPALGLWAMNNWRLLLGGAALAFFAIALLIARSDARHWHKKFDNAEAGRLVEIDKHKITRASVETCARAVHDQNASIEALKAASDKRTADAEQALEAARKASESAEGRARALEVSASKPRSGAVCRGSAEYEAAKGEL